MSEELRDISEMTNVDLRAYQQKVSAGADMKTAIKRFLDTRDRMFTGGLVKLSRAQTEEYNRRLRALRQAMEAWCNLTGEAVE